MTLYVIFILDLTVYGLLDAINLAYCRDPCANHETTVGWIEEILRMEDTNERRALPGQPLQQGHISASSKLEPVHVL
jgi:hypothetical protein